MLAWGIVPTGKKAFELNARELAESVLRSAEKVAGFGGGVSAGDVLTRSFISEACGLGSRDVETASDVCRWRPKSRMF